MKIRIKAIKPFLLGDGKTVAQIGDTVEIDRHDLAHFVEHGMGEDLEVDGADKRQDEDIAPSKPAKARAKGD